MKTLILLLSVLLAAPLFAQDKPAATVTQAKQKAADFAQPDKAPATAAPFTELEQAKLQAIAYEGAAIEADQRTLDLRKQLWQGKVAAFKSAAEHERPGFTWEADSGKWTAKPEVKK